jgi:hypothetical protein
MHDISDEILNKIIDLRKRIGKDHIILISDDNAAPVELCDLSKTAVRCAAGTNCDGIPIGKKHDLQNGTSQYICRKHLKEQGYYKP